MIFYYRVLITIMAFLFANTHTIFDHKTPALIPKESEMTRPIPAQAIEIIKRYEGLRTKAYQDSNGIWTIGYGNTHEVSPGEEISEQDAENELREYLQSLGPSIIRVVKLPLNNNQYSALLSFTYNVGLGNLEKSHLLQIINSKNDGKVVQEFLKWDHDSKGHELNGLKARRLAEASLYFLPLSQVS